VGVDHWGGKCARNGLVGLHRKGLWVRGTTMISAKRGRQCNRFQIRFSGKVGGSIEKQRIISDGYHCD
jgi:hypothetical protein